MKRKTVLAAMAASAMLVTTAAGQATASVGRTSRMCAQPNGRVTDIALSGGTAYLGGSFTGVKDLKGTTQPRSRLAAIDMKTCDLLPWNPGADADVYAVEASGNTVYVGGAFTQVGGKARSELAAVDATTGSATAFNPVVNKAVRSLVASADTLYAGGDFTKVNGSSRSRLAAFSLTSGALTSWAPNASGAVYALAISADSASVYVGGNFTSLNGKTAYPYMGAVTTGSGATDSSFQPGAQFPILALTADSRGVYAGAGGSGGHLVIWNLDGSLQQPVYQTDGGVQGVAVDGDSLYAGGHFGNYCIGNTGSGHPFLCDKNLPRKKLFEVSLASGQLTSWAPSLNSPRGAFAVVVDPATHQLWVGGDFTKVGSASVAHFAVFS
jgi:hypothetical protein